MEVVTHSVLVSYRSEQTNYPTLQQTGVDVVSHFTFSVLEKNRNLVKSASSRSYQLLVQKLNYNQTMTQFVSNRIHDDCGFQQKVLCDQDVSAHKQSNQNATYVLNCYFFLNNKINITFEGCLKKDNMPSRVRFVCQNETCV